MEPNTLLIVDTRLEQGLLAKATNREYSDNDFQKDIAVLSADQRIEKMLSVSVRANRSTVDFRRDMQAKFVHCADHRAYIERLRFHAYPNSTKWMATNHLVSGV